MHYCKETVNSKLLEKLNKIDIKSFKSTMSIAHGSLAELETHIQIAERLNYVYEDQIKKRLR